METNEEKYYPIQGLSPLYPVHPGDILGEELKEMGLSQKTFAESIGMQPSHLSALIHGARNFTRAVATKVADGLPGISADYWMRMQESYNADVRRRRIHPSSLVSGYQRQETPVPALADPTVPYGGRLHVQLTIPAEDSVLLNQLAARFGWTVE